jgi:hypothetical protein
MDKRRIIYIKPINAIVQSSLFKQHKQACETVLTGFLFFAIMIGFIVFSWGLTPEIVSQ